MKNFRKYWIYIIIYTAVVCVLMTFATIYSTRNVVINRLENDIHTATLISSQIGSLSSSFVNDADSLNINRQKSLQKALSLESDLPIYLSVINWSGKIIAHPEVIRTDGIADYYDAQSLTADSEFETSSFYNNLNNLKEDQVISMNAIDQTDWIIVSHLNINSYKEFKSNYLFHNTVLFAVIGLCIFLVTILVLRFMKSYYERKMEEKELIFSDRELNFSKLNESLERYQEITLQEINKTNSKDVAVVSSDNSTKTVDLQEGNKTRILTYVRNELLPIAVEDIAYIYVENTITYFIRKDGKRSTSNESLDQIFTSLDERYFFKANRQFIVSISSIEKIVKYGNSQLKLVVTPTSELEIVIGKNKAASFKKWLNI